MKYNPVTRRHFLQGLGGFTLSLPFLESLAPHQAFAAGLAPTRFIAIKSYNGQRKKYWDPILPNGAQPTIVGPHIQTLPLSHFNSGGINSILGPSFTPFHSKMNFIQGLDYIPQVGHNKGGILGNFNDNTPTIDQVLAKSKKIYPGEPSIRSLLLGYMPATTGSFSYDVSNGTLLNLPAYNNVQAAFDRVFFSANPAQKLRHTTVVDAVLQDYQNLKTNKRLSANDRAAMDRHLTGIQELNTRLKTSAPLACPTTPVRAGLPYPISSALPNIDQYYKDITDLMAIAIMCGATRIATLQIEHPKTYGGSDWHGPSHDRENLECPILLEINQYLAQKVVLELAKKLDVPEADGKTYLDNSAILWGNEISIGWSHVNVNMPTVLIGSMGGKFKTGNFINYSNDGKIWAPGNEQYFGRPYNQLLVSILQGMGLSPADYETGGKPGYAVAASLDPARTAYYQQFQAQLGKPLSELNV